MNSKSKNFEKARKALNPNNQFIFDNFLAFKRKCESISNYKLAKCYQKILKSLSKYPLPLLSGKIMYKVKI